MSTLTDEEKKIAKILEVSEEVYEKHLINWKRDEYNKMRNYIVLSRNEKEWGYENGYCPIDFAKLKKEGHNIYLRYLLEKLIEKIK